MSECGGWRQIMPEDEGFFKKASEDAFVTYQAKVVENCKVLASALLDSGFSLVSGGTDNHLILIDL